ncbi:winged helix-turn-helix transcriptional regulator [Lentibacter algarum]|nr:winged helix-turn-helix transcriptional regulator [Lentibacter algarum]
MSRVPYATVPPKVGYSLTEIGKSTAPVVEAISQWGEEYLHAVKAGSLSPA